MWRDLSKAVRELWRLSSPGTGSYRPDLHYMRGPGPKWHAKYGGLNHNVTSKSAHSGSALRDVAEHRV
jgi:hypothetical protein